MPVASKVEGRPRTFRVQGSAANKQEGSDGAVWLFLLEDGAEAAAAGVTVLAEGAGIVDNCGVVGENQDRGGGELAKNLADGDFRGRDKKEFGHLFEQGRDGAKAFGEVPGEVSVVAQFRQ